MVVATRRSCLLMIAATAGFSIACGGGQAGNSSFNSGFATVAADGGISSVGFGQVALAHLTSNPLPATCADWATARDAGNVTYDAQLGINFYNLDGGQIFPGTYAACHSASGCPGLTTVVQFSGDGGVTAETQSQGSVVLSSVGAQYVGSYDVTATIVTGGSGTMHLTGTFNVPACQRF